MTKDPLIDNSYQIINSIEQIETLCKILSENNMLSDNFAWKHLNLSHGVVELHPETIAEFTPHNLNLPQINAVNFNKGCYTGQEVIARMEFRGKLKSHLYHGDTKLSDRIKPGQSLILNDKSVGYLVDMNRHQQELELIMLLKDSEAGKTIHIEKHNSPITNIKKVII